MAGDVEGRHVRQSNVSREQESEEPEASLIDESHIIRLMIQFLGTQPLGEDTITTQRLAGLSTGKQLVTARAR